MNMRSTWWTNVAEGELRVAHVTTDSITRGGPCPQLHGEPARLPTSTNRPRPSERISVNRYKGFKAAHRGEPVAAIGVEGWPRRDGRLVPDFSLELERCDELERSYEDSPYWNLLFVQWVEQVHGKLQSWNPQKARRFLSTSIFESSGGVYMLDEDPNTTPILVELRLRRCRLELLVRPTKISKVMSLIRP
jgi:hypothetical protein